MIEGDTGRDIERGIREREREERESSIGEKVQWEREGVRERIRERAREERESARGTREIARGERERERRESARGTIERKREGDLS